MTIYLDNDYKCHVTDDGTMLAHETETFQGKCTAYIEGYRIVPAGHEWTRPDGRKFRGEMIAPWRDIDLLREFQTQYEQQQAETEALKAELADADAALAELGVTIDG